MRSSRREAEKTVMVSRKLTSQSRLTSTSVVPPAVTSMPSRFSELAPSVKLSE